MVFIDSDFVWFSKEDEGSSLAKLPLVVTEL